MSIAIRVARPSDAAAIATIYMPYVTDTVISFEMAPPDKAEMANRLAKTLARFPWLVAESDGEVVGYAYAEQLRDRPAYRFTCENSIYVRADRVGQGLGKALLRELCERCESLGFRQMIAVIGGGEPSSIALHQSCGFEVVGRLSSVGWKKGRWLDTVYMQRALGHGAETSPSNI